MAARIYDFELMNNLNPFTYIWQYATMSMSNTGIVRYDCFTFILISTEHIPRTVQPHLHV
jgi:hypothetical protein